MKLIHNHVEKRQTYAFTVCFVHNIRLLFVSWIYYVFVYFLYEKFYMCFLQFISILESQIKMQMQMQIN